MNSGKMGKTWRQIDMVLPLLSTTQQKRMLKSA
jgi:hypothetical protein